MPLISRNPATGEAFGAVDALGAEAVDAAVTRAVGAFASWRTAPLSTRAAVLLHAADLLDAEASRLGRLMTLEMGKPIGAAEDEAKKCARGCRYYAEQGAAFLADEPVKTEATSSYIRHEPLGVILAIMPWNFPFWQVFRFAAPALVAGNVGLLKHASNVPRCAAAIEDVLRRAGCPDGVFQSLPLSSSLVASLLEDDRIAAVTLTGSEGAGRDVASRAGRGLKKVVLELGGSDPFIVMPSADFERALTTAVKARIVNNGESCIAAKRFIVHRDIAGTFVPRFVEAMAALRVGDPIDRSTDIGPLAMPQLVDDLDRQVRDTVRQGGRVLTGGARLPGPGSYYAPTVLIDIPPGSPADQEELFGPVASVFVVESLDAAIAKANDSRFGLGASAWTTDPAEQRRFANDLEAGQVFVNAMVASDPRMPFGGVKASGHGRELSRYGMLEFLNIKTVWMS
jgi:succinate-semialdehyde dehydrogenase/glutarate-semialdehyde dehydrogenase